MVKTTSYNSPCWSPDDACTEHALEQARTVVGSDRAVDDLARYYAADSNYAGTTFIDLRPNDPDTITASDLLAVTTLSVEVSPHAIRTFQRSAAEIGERLGALDPGLRLEAVDPEITATSMAALYELVKVCLRRAGAETGNAWVTASKICARKRPQLFPVRDNAVLELLGLPKTYPVDWPAFQALVSDEALMQALDEHVEAADKRDGVDVGDHSLRLRHLDVVLWMRATHRRS